MAQKPLSLGDTRATLEAIDAAMDALGAAPPAAFEYLDDRFTFHKTMLGRIVDALDKAQDGIVAHLRELEIRGGGPTCESEPTQMSRRGSGTSAS